MLIEFSVTNFRSISSTQTLSLTAGKSSAEIADYSTKTHHPSTPNVLKVAGIFGSNGAGKSSLLKAMYFLQNFVEKSSSSNSKKIQIDPHIYDEEWAESPSAFEIIFLANNKIYQYGFSINREIVYDEWMYVRESSASSRIKTIYSRSFDEDTNDYKWNISRNILSKDKDIWKRSTRKNSLYLSTAVSLNSEELLIPYNYIIDKLRIVMDARKLDHAYSIQKIIENKDSWKKEILSFLSNVDIKIDDINTEIGDFDEKIDIPSDIPKSIADEIIKTMITNMKDHKIIRKIETVRKSKQNKDTFLPLDEESSGSKALFSLSAPIVHVLKDGLILILDEMNSALHPLAVQYIVNIFNDHKINKNGAQLIFTGHETLVLEKDIMHNDQIWIVEKTDNLNTILFPLSKFKNRYINNIRNNYLTGRFGGVPIINYKNIKYGE